MSTSSQVSAHAIREHFKKRDLTCVLSLLREFRGPELAQLIEEYIFALMQAQSGPARDNAFTALIGWLIGQGRLEEATAALRAIGDDSRVRREPFAREIEARLRECID